jgi:hypothetical protein
MILRGAFKMECAGAIGNILATFQLAAAFSWKRNNIPYSRFYGDSPLSHLILNHTGEVPPHKRGETKLLGGKIHE